MSIASTLLPEFEHEMSNTRKLLEVVPEHRANWKPHPKSFSTGELALHLANIPSWGVRTLHATEFDLATVLDANVKPPAFESVRATLAVFDANVRTAADAIGGANDADFAVGWKLKKGGATMFTLPRATVLRSFVLSHVIHHRGQLTVYLRCCDVPLPSIYGPTADAPF